MKRWLHLTGLHLRYVNLSFWRNPSAAFFGMAFPLMFLVINALLLGDNTMEIGGQKVGLATFYVAGMSVFAVIMTCFTNLAVSILFDRDQGRLKRLRGTPTPVSAYIVARVLFAVFVGLLTSGLCVAIGVAFFKVQVQVLHLPLFFACLGLGACALAAIALAAVAVIPNAQAGPAMLNLLTFPVVFISGVFYPMHGAPAWLATVAGSLPVRPLANAAIGAFFGLGVSWRELLVLLAWAVGGVLVAAKFFRWQPAR